MLPQSADIAGLAARKAANPAAIAEARLYFKIYLRPANGVSASTLQPATLFLKGDFSTPDPW
jgi:hypothetical protein